MAVMKIFSRSPEKGAETLVWLTDSSDIIGHNGYYYADKKIQRPSDNAQNLDMARELWKVSEKSKPESEVHSKNPINRSVNDFWSQQVNKRWRRK